MTNQEAIRLIRNLTTRCEFTDAYGEPIDSDAYYEAVDMAISALQALDEIYAFIMKSEASETTDGVLEIYDALESQEAKAQLSAEGTTSDLISRRVAVDALWEIRQKEISDGRRFHDYCSLSTAVDVIKDLPSAHPEIEERTEEFAQNVPKEDLISRKAAIEALGERPMVWTDDDQYALGERNQYDMNRLAIETLPSAQPERKTGRWLIREGISDAQCSECKMYFRDVYDMDNSDAFCRHCGAKMEGLKVVEDD